MIEREVSCLALQSSVWGAVSESQKLTFVWLPCCTQFSHFTVTLLHFHFYMRSMLHSFFIWLHHYFPSLLLLTCFFITNYQLITITLQLDKRSIYQSIYQHLCVTLNAILVLSIYLSNNKFINQSINTYVLHLMQFLHQSLHQSIYVIKYKFKKWQILILKIM